MDMLKRFDNVKEFIETSELNLVEDTAGDFEMLDNKRDEILNKYRVSELEVVARYERERAALDALCDQAQTLVDGINRRLFAKQQRQLSGTANDTPEQALERLRREIGNFESTILPYGIKQFVDSIALMFNSSYGQREVDRIVQLYNTVLQVNDSRELENKRDEEIQKLRDERNRRIQSLERMMSSNLEERVDSYILDLEKQIFS